MHVNPQSADDMAQLQENLQNNDKGGLDTPVAQQANDDGLGIDISMDGAKATPDKPEDRPEWLPEKFKTPEDMANAYAELEKKMSQGITTETPKDEGLGIKKDSEGEEGAEEPKEGEDKESPVVDISAIEQEYNTDGSLSKDTYDKLAKVGIPPEVVDTYIQATEANVKAYNDSLVAEAGSLEEYQAMVSWAATNKSDKYIADYDELIQSGTKPEIAKTVVRELYQEFVKANGSKGHLLHGGGKPSSGIRAYADQGEFMKDINNPLYKARTPEGDSFRKTVEARIAAGTQK